MSDKESPFSEIRTITPDQAREWLKQVPEYQRRLDQKHCSKIAMAITRNEWRVNGAAIVFNERGDLIDGQHRLTAISLAGRSVQALVVTGVSKDELTFASLGDSKSRTTSDFLHVKNANTVAAVLRLLWFVDNRMFTSIYTRAGRGQIPNPPIGELVRMGKKIGQNISDLVEPLNNARRITGSGTWLVFLTYYHENYRPIAEGKRVAEFMARLGDGAELTKDSPILLLRKRCLDRKIKLGLAELPKKVIEALTLKALNAFLEGKKLERLVWLPDRENFPSLKGYDLDSEHEKPLFKGLDEHPDPKPNGLASEARA